MVHCMRTFAIQVAAGFLLRSWPKEFTRNTDTRRLMNYRVAQTFTSWIVILSQRDNKPLSDFQKNASDEKTLKELLKRKLFFSKIFLSPLKTKTESSRLKTHWKAKKCFRRCAGDTANMKSLKGKSSNKKRISEPTASLVHTLTIWGTFRVKIKSVKRKGSRHRKRQKKRWWENLWRRKVFSSILYYYEEKFKSSQRWGQRRKKVAIAFIITFLFTGFSPPFAVVVSISGSGDKLMRSKLKIHYFYIKGERLKQ